jgi:hypothetical protein
MARLATMLANGGVRRPAILSAASVAEMSRDQTRRRSTSPGPLSPGSASAGTLCRERAPVAAGVPAGGAG